MSSKGTGVVRSLVETSATNTVIDVAQIEARSSGTPAAGIGSGLLFATETAANNFEIGARIDAITTDVTSTSEDFDLSFKVMAGGAAAVEVMRIRSTGVVDVDALSIDGTTVTSTAAELNVLDGISGIASQAEAEAGTATDKLMTPQRAEDHMLANAIGWGQTWQTVSRTSGVSYQNTTGRPIMIAFAPSGSGDSLEISSDNTTFFTVGSGSGAANTWNYGIVPNQHYYKFGSGTKRELR